MEYIIATAVIAAVVALRTNLSDIADALPVGMAKEQIGNVVTVLSVVPDILDAQIAAAEPVEPEAAE